MIKKVGRISFNKVAYTMNARIRHMPYDKYELLKTPISYSEYVRKVDYRKYFNLIGVPQEDSVIFHQRVSMFDVEGAAEAIKGFFYAKKMHRNLKLIRLHIANAVERLKMGTVQFVEE